MILYMIVLVRNNKKMRVFFYEKPILLILFPITYLCSKASKGEDAY
jgi:hypothetical protein